MEGWCLFKFRIALILAGIAGVLTLLSGFWSDARPATALYRAGISATVFGCCGFVFGGMAEPFLVKAPEKLNHKGQKLDIIDKGDGFESEVELSQQPSSEQNFRPLTPDMVKRVYRSS